MPSVETVQQRRVAATSIDKPSGASSSVFDMARAAKPPRKTRTLLPPLDVGSIKIRSGIPIPNPTRAPGTSPYRQLLDKLKPGDSVELDESYAKSLVSAAKKAGIKLAVRRVENGGGDRWRLAPVRT